ncbi:MAG: PucR family transcriptional regulator [Thermoleophilia bacterium]|nr:PucR family transcriptional regulator [Thermoleophilia bacterium]
MHDGRTDDALTVRELVRQSDLGLDVLGGGTGLDRAVEAVYIGDLDDPTPWMVQGSLLLTTGPKLEAQPETGARLVHLLAAAGMVGVGVAITPHVSEIPGAMVAAAEEAGLPLLRVPPGTPFRRVTSYVFNALASRDMHRLRRSLALQQNLVEVLIAEKSVGGLVGRLGELLDVTAVLLDADGRELARSGEAARQGPGDGPRDRSGDALVRLAWSAYRRTVHEGLPRSVVHVRDRNVAFREVHLHGAVEQVLFGIPAHDGLISEFSDAALSFVQRLLEAELVTLQSAGLLRRRTRAGLLEMLLQGRGDAAELGERLRQHGIDPTEEWRVAAFEAVAPAPGPKPGQPAVQKVIALPDEALSAVDHLLEERLAPFLSCREGEQVLVLSPLGPPPDDLEAARRLVAEIAEAVCLRLHVPAVAVGLSEALAGLAAAPRAAGQARLALTHIETEEPGAARVVAFDELGGRYRLLESLPDELLEQLVRGVVGRLEATDERGGSDLAATLHCFLEHGCSTVETADRLYVHRNTLRKRLARIEEVTGVSLASTGGRVEAYLSARAADVLATRRR